MTSAPQDPSRIHIRRAQVADHPSITSLAQVTWRASFQGIISPEQIEYMLAQRYTPEALREATASGRLTFELLTIDNVPRAFAAHGSTPEPSELKLHQLYVHPEWQGAGLGGRLIHHVEAIARDLGRTALVLTVNRHNHAARAVYERRGFIIRGEATFDIGQGFVMDDYLMEKRWSQS